MTDLGITDEVVNVNGEATSPSTTVGMSGTQVALTLLHELKRRGGGTGAAALCGGGGQGDAILLEEPGGDGPTAGSAPRRRRRSGRWRRRRPSICWCPARRSGCSAS